MVMVVRAVMFDVGGVLELTPDLGVERRWEEQLGLPAGALGERLADVWSGGEVGAITEADVHRAVKDRLGLHDQQVEALMGDIWRQYLGTANTELIEYVHGLRPRYRTGIISNSFVGAREREQAAYGFEDLDSRVEGARQAGLQGVLYQDNAQVMAELDALLAARCGHPKLLSHAPASRRAARASGTFVPRPALMLAGCSANHGTHG